MVETEHLLNRLNAIGQALSKTGTAIALIGLGSAGLDLDKLDEYSDLDFFVIVREGSKEQYLQDLSWLTEIAPVAFYFQNTADGHKLLYQDGVFCEFAVFEPDELAEAIYPPGRIVWKAEGVSDSIAVPKRPPKVVEKPSTTWLVGEALTNLYVGLMRDRRGERLSGMRFIQGYAVDRVLQLAEVLGRLETPDQDPFNLERRFEARFPSLEESLPAFLQGYHQNRESALAILAFLEAHFEVNPAMAAEIKKIVR